MIDQNELKNGILENKKCTRCLAIGEITTMHVVPRQRVHVSDDQSKSIRVQLLRWRTELVQEPTNFRIDNLRIEFAALRAVLHGHHGNGEAILKQILIGSRIGKCELETILVLPQDELPVVRSSCVFDMLRQLLIQLFFVFNKNNMSVKTLKRLQYRVKF